MMTQFYHVKGIYPYIEYKFNKDLVNAQKWLSANKLTLNNEKTKYMIIGSRQRLTNLDHVSKISINGHQIERVYKKEVLGIVIDDRLRIIITNSDYTIRSSDTFQKLETS